MLSVVVELGTDVVKFEPAEDKKTYTSDFTVLVRFSDANKQVVDKMSQRYQIGGPIEKMADAKNGQVVFYRQPELPPGFYTMETVVYDSLAQKASVRFTTVEQPNEDAAKLRMSSLVLVSRGEHVDRSRGRQPADRGDDAALSEPRDTPEEGVRQGAGVLLRGVHRQRRRRRR